EFKRMVVPINFSYKKYNIHFVIASYINPCGKDLKDSNYNQCIKSNIDSVKDKICTGMPELNILPLEPLIIDKLIIFDAENIKSNVKNIKTYGFCDFDVNSVYSNSDRNHISLDFNLKHLQLNGSYDFNARLLTQIVYNGLIQITIDNLAVKVELNLKTITKNGNKYSYVSKINFNLDIKDFDFKIDESRKELADLYKIIKDIIDTNKKDIVKRVKSPIEKEVSERIISILNDVFRRTNYEELFPEKTRIV
ncbi:hypothetical protein ALC62_15148, partial [Cyphomyrmex costatus]